MISFTVGTTFLTDWLLGQRGHEADARLRQALQRLFVEPVSVAKEDDLRAHCAYGLFEKLFQKLRPILTGDLSEYVTRLKDELQRTASEVYFQPSFSATEEDAENWLAIHELRPHGRITLPGSAATKEVFLPEFANRVELYCYFSGFGLPPREDEKEDQTILNLLFEPAFQKRQDQLRVHLCDSLHSVYSRVSNVAEQLRVEYAEAGGTDGRLFRPSKDEELLILDAHIGGFRAYRSLRRDFASIPPLGGHRLLVASAIRQGLGMPVISAMFPRDVWVRLPKPVKHFVLSAAEQVGKSRCEPLYPNIPSSDALKSLNYEVNAGFVDSMSPGAPGHAPTLKMLGFGDTLSRRKAEQRQRAEEGAYAGDWNDVADELVTAIYSDEVEQSLHLQDVLDLYPLHKRVLGLVEYIIIPELIAKNVEGVAPGERWVNAFIGWKDKTGKKRPGLGSASLPRVTVHAPASNEGVG